MYFIALPRHLQADGSCSFQIACDGRKRKEARQRPFSINWCN